MMVSLGRLRCIRITRVCNVAISLLGSIQLGDVDG